MILVFQNITHTFKFVAPSQATSVNIAGSFNGWNKDATAMKRDADGRTWSIKLDLPAGKTTYKFVVNGSDWQLDPNARAESDGNGNENSVLLNVPSDYAKPARKNDGTIAKSAIEHKLEVPFVNYDRGQLTIQVRVRPNDIQSITLIANGKRMPMTEAPGDDLYAMAKASIPWNGKSAVQYRFELTDGSAKTELGPFKLSPSTYHPIVVPKWTEGTVLYSIFPDRFANGDPKNDPKGTKPWGSKPNYRDYNGGDVAGVESHLGYLKSLGIGGIYFCPIFASPVYHRYETSDYRKVDPSFGTNVEFARLTKELAANGIHTVLDGVFNHTATKFFAFNDIVKEGPNSNYNSWYWIKSYPIQIKENPNYVAWFNYPSLPKLNVNTPAARNYLLDTAEYWNKNSNLSGWRLDCGNEVSQDFWKAFRTKVKSLNPEAWIVGENWGNSQTWLKGDQWDSTMNYPFALATIDFFKPNSKVKPSEYMGRLFANYDLYAPQVSRNLMNLLDSHDTPRILTQLEGRSDLRDLAAVMQMTWPGTPCIYYGDELGMAGEKDPENRRCVDWSSATDANQTLQFYRKIVSIRNSSQTLRHGEPKLLFADDAKGLLVFGRTYQGHTAVVAINRSGSPMEVTVPFKQAGDSSLRMAFGPKPKLSNTSISFQLQSLRAAILVPSRDLQSSSSPRHKTGAMSIPSSEIP